MKICFYGAGSKEIKPEYTKEAYKLGEELVKRGHDLVFGGGENGMMGAVSKGALDNGGNVLGIAPSWINEFEPLENKCTSFIYTETMDERKNWGIGTLDEFFEAITLKALNQHDKKIVIFNCNHFFDKINETFLHMANEGVIKRDINDLFQVRHTVEEVLDYLESEED